MIKVHQIVGKRDNDSLVLYDSTGMMRNGLEDFDSYYLILSSEDNSHTKEIEITEQIAKQIVSATFVLGKNIAYNPSETRIFVSDFSSEESSSRKVHYSQGSGCSERTTKNESNIFFTLVNLNNNKESRVWVESSSRFSRIVNLLQENKGYSHIELLSVSFSCSGALFTVESENKPYVDEIYRNVYIEETKRFCFSSISYNLLKSFLCRKYDMKDFEILLNIVIHDNLSFTKLVSIDNNDLWSVSLALKDIL